MEEGYFSDETARLRVFNIVRSNFDFWGTRFVEMERIYSEFEELGISKVPASRIRSYRIAFQKLKGAADRGEQLDIGLGHALLNAEVEFSQLRKILSAVHTAKDDVAWRRQLVRLISGHELASKDSAKTSSRNFQFEAFIAAVCKLGGYHVEFNEPDLVISNEDVRLGIAAKRPRSNRKIEKNCRDAAKQIQRSGRKGLVALDLSFALYADQCINTNAISGGHLFVKSAVDNYVENSFNKLKYLCREELILGVLLHLHLPTLNFEVRDNPQVGTVIRWAVVPFVKNDVDGVAWTADFVKRCEIGLFGPRDQSFNEWGKL